MPRTVLITGGTTGIGACTAQHFKDAGYTVAVNYARNDEGANAFAEQTGIPTFKWDVSNPQACLDGVQNVQEKLGAVDILVNNAGIIRDRSLQKMTVDEWESVLDTDLGSCFHMARAVLPAMKERKFGRIISISSVNALSGQFGQTNYAAAKAGIIGFSKSLALETAHNGITVNVVAPGYTETAMMKDVKEDVLKGIVSKIPLGRLARPSEIARSIFFLAQDESEYITGETLSINGGLYMQ
jgi:acetoacetyl-CoA reductase